jgi:hypothetical protein
LGHVSAPAPVRMQSAVEPLCPAGSIISLRADAVQAHAFPFADASRTRKMLISANRLTDRVPQSTFTRLVHGHMDRDRTQRLWAGGTVGLSEGALLRAIRPTDRNPELRAG